MLQSTKTFSFLHSSFWEKVVTQIFLNFHKMDMIKIRPFIKLNVLLKSVTFQQQLNMYNHITGNKQLVAQLIKTGQI